jgi:Dolichyl-phosphate-mannose-protein mannosyltransferase
MRRSLLQHWPFLIVAAVGVTVRILASISFRPALMFVGDSYGYLLRAASLEPGLVRPIFYPFVLAPFQRIGHVEWIPLAQHLLGLGIGVAIYALLRRLGIGVWGATLGATPILLDAYELNIEQFIMAEVVFTALLVAALVLLLWRRPPGWFAVACAGVCIGCATLTREVGIVLIVPVIVFLLVRRAGLLRTGVALAFFAAPLLVYSAWFQSVNGSFGLSGHDGFFLYGRVATFADCSASEIPYRERLLCDPRPPSERPFANFYVWGSESPTHRLIDSSGTESNGILKDFSMRVIRHQPLDYARTIVGDFFHFLAPGRRTGPQDEPLQIWQFSEGMPILEHVFFTIPSCLAHPTGDCAAAQRLCFHQGVGCMQLLPTGPAHPGIVAFLQGYQRIVFLPGPVLALTILLGLAGGLGVRGRWNLRAESLLLTVVGILVLIVPVMTVMFDYRYMLPSLALLPPAGVLGTVALRDRIRLGRSRRASGERGEPSENGPGAPGVRAPDLIRVGRAVDHGRGTNPS